VKLFTDPQEILAKTSLVDNFIEIVKIDSQSDETVETMPSTAAQLDVQRVLQPKLAALGCTDIVLDENGYLFATFPGNVADKPVIGLLAHVDTATDYPASGVKPQLHENYDGSPITLGNDIVIAPADSPELKDCLGDTIITADGTTLLGADDKAGVAAILAGLEMLKNDDSIPHPTLRIGFTPDEEIGKGASKFDIERFAAFAAYTFDGGKPGELNAETFSADGATVKFTGVAVHPGYAKDKMVNAMRYAAKFLTECYPDESPERTSGRNGFFHPLKIEGNASEVKITFILRDFDDQLLADRGRRLKELVAKIAAEEPRLQTEVQIKEQYRNMAKWLKDKPEIAAKLDQAIKDAGLTPDSVPVRGGTDGSGLTAKGLPTPNVFCGAMLMHGPREWVSTRAMGLATCTMLNLVQRWAE